MSTKKSVKTSPLQKSNSNFNATCTPITTPSSVKGENHNNNNRSSAFLVRLTAYKSLLDRLNKALNGIHVSTANFYGEIPVGIFPTEVSADTNNTFGIFDEQNDALHVYVESMEKLAERLETII